MKNKQVGSSELAVECSEGRKAWLAVETTTSGHVTFPPLPGTWRAP
jgi:hypothetical protein